jgi:hypothetical protein
MKAVDSSVVVAAFASWHEHHAIAQGALAIQPRLIALAAVESYSVLTRLPSPHRAQPSLVHSFITERFADPFLTLSAAGYQQLTRRGGIEPDPRWTRLRCPDRLHRRRASSDPDEPRPTSRGDVPNRRRHGRAAGHLTRTMDLYRPHLPELVGRSGAARGHLGDT